MVFLKLFCTQKFHHESSDVQFSPRASCARDPLTYPTTAMSHKKIMYRRLYYLAETNKWIPDSQTAYLQNHTTVDPLIAFTADITEGFNKRQSTVFLSIDFSKAFDRVYTQLMLYKLHELRIRGRMLSWITDFLSNRK